MIKVTFCGAARQVTGSCHLIELSDGHRILLDCGLYQGGDDELPALNASFPFKADTIDTVILSHAHIDHAGRLPMLVKKGFRGDIHTTHATRSLCSIMLMDSAMIQERDAQYANNKLKRQGKSKKYFLEPLYTKDDVYLTMQGMIGHSYHSWFRINEKISVYFSDAGHILGSASVVLKIRDDGKETMIGFTGDIGRPNRPILRDPEMMHECDYLICESTYGNRVHESRPEEVDKLLAIIKETCLVDKGKLIIPAFSLGRTQEIVHLLDHLENEGALPHIPVYVDSPLAVNATKIFGVHPECYDEALQKYILTDPNPFGFNRLTYITDVADSKRLNTSQDPCIIISAAGMANAGRVQHHLANNIENPRTSVLMVGYCAPNTTGGILKAGAKQIKLFGEYLNVNAKIKSMDSFSAHGDKLEMMDFVKNQRDKNQRMFLVHGDYDAQMAFSEELVNFGFDQVDIPYLGQQVVLS
jgi:metallo-beta-lactamase family protein